MSGYRMCKLGKILGMNNAMYIYRDEHRFGGMRDESKSGSRMWDANSLAVAGF